MIRIHKEYRKDNYGFTICSENGWVILTNTIDNFHSKVSIPLNIFKEMTKDIINEQG